MQGLVYTHLLYVSHFVYYYRYLFIFNTVHYRPHFCCTCTLAIKILGLGHKEYGSKTDLLKNSIMSEKARLILSSGRSLNVSLHSGHSDLSFVSQ